MGTVYFIAYHAVTGIAAYGYVARLERLPEAGPAAARIELGVSVEQRLIATHAAVDARIMAIPVFTRERRLCAALAAHLVLFRGEFVAPFGVSFFYFLHCRIIYLKMSFNQQLSYIFERLQISAGFFNPADGLFPLQYLSSMICQS